MDSRLREALDEVRVRSRELVDPDAWAAVVERERPRAVSSARSPRWPSFLPLPAQDIPWVPAPWLAAADQGDPDAISYDREGRFVLLGPEGRTVWTFGVDHDEELERTEDDWDGSPVVNVTRILHPGGGPPIGAVRSGNDDDWVALWRHDGEGRLSRVEQATAKLDSWMSAHATEATYDEHGDVLALHVGGGDLDFRDDNRLPADEVDRALDRGLLEAAGLACGTLGWDATVSRPEPLRPDLRGMGAGLAGGLIEAMSRAAVAADLEPVACVEVDPRRDGDRTFPPRVFVGGEAWVAGMRRRRQDPHENLHRGVEAGHVRELDLAPFADPATLLACRELWTVLDRDFSVESVQRINPVLEELAETLARGLRDPAVWPATTDDYLAIVLVNAEFRDWDAESPRQRAERIFGSGSGADGPTAPADPADGDDAVGGATGPRDDRDALERTLAAAGLEDHAHRLAYQEAELGLIAVAADASVRSRIGGAPVLPPDVAWPTTDDGRPLSFLAAVDLAEVPQPERGPAWPRAGWLLAFADVDGDPEEGPIRLYESEDNSDGSGARLLAVDAADEPVAATPPGGASPSAPRERRVSWAPVLTLPAPEDVGLDLFATEAYDEVRFALEAPTVDDDDGDELAAHWIRGRAEGAQGEAPDPNTTLLLHLSDDSSLDLEILGGGTLQFRLANEDVPAWTMARVSVAPASG